MKILSQKKNMKKKQYQENPELKTEYEKKNKYEKNSETKREYQKKKKKKNAKQI